MSKSKSVSQAILFDVDSNKQVSNPIAEKTKTKTKELDISKLGINQGDFSNYIKNGRNNNLTWNK